MSDAHANALLAGRAGIGIGRLFVWRPLMCAAIFWLLYAVCTSVAAVAAAAPPDVRHIEGTTVEVTYSYVPAANTAALAASWMQLFALVTTIGALTVGVLRFFSPRSAQRRSHSRVAVAAGHVAAEHRRAKRDVANAKARLGKVGDRRARRWGKRWSGEAAAGEPYSQPGRADRWILRQAKPPKTKAAKKANRAAKKVGKAAGKAEQVQVDAEWATELAAIEGRMAGNGVATSTKKIIRDGKKVGDAMRVDAGGPASQVEAWRQVIEDPTEGELPPPPPFVAAPSPVTPTVAADRLANVAGPGDRP